VAEQVAFFSQVTTQPSSHLMSHFELSAQRMVPSSPRLTLQFAESLHVALAPEPALRSHFEDPVHEMLLPGPPLPLHSAVPEHATSRAASELPLHFEPSTQSRAQAASPQSATQSAPISQEQLVSTHAQSPVHAGAAASDVPLSSPPQATTMNDSSRHPEHAVL
jgi:hypothetical protein